MNETLRTLLYRRSIRKFKSTQIKDEELKSVLKAGMYAPTGGNRQSPLFVVVQNKETLKKIDRLNSKVLGKDTHPYFHAPTVILVFADKNKSTPVEDASLALGNMFNAAASLGLGTCWVHREKQMFETEEGKSLLKEWGVDDCYIGVGACVIGYPDCNHPEPSPRKKDYVIYIK